MSHRTVPNEAGNHRAARAPPWQGAVRWTPPTRNPHRYNGQYGPGFISVMTPGDTLPPPLPTHRTPLFRRGSSGGCRNHPPWGGFIDAFHGKITARPRMGGRRAVLGRQCRGDARRDRPLMGSRPRPPPEGEGGDEIGFSRDLCVCICTKVVCVSIDLTCFCWEVFWGWTFFWELSSFGSFLSLSFFFVRDDG